MPTAPTGMGQTLLRLIRVRNVAIILVGAIAMLAINHALNNWLPKILENTGLTPVQAGYWAALSNAAGIVGVLLIPRAIRPEHRKWALAALLVVMAGTVTGVGLLEGAFLLVCVGLFGLARMPVMTLCVLVLMETPQVGSRHMGVAMGLYFALGEIGGFGGPFLLGALLDLTGGFVWGLSGLGVLAALLAGMMLFLQGRPGPITAS